MPILKMPRLTDKFCFECGRSLSFDSVQQHLNNRYGDSVDAYKLFNSPYIQFYCCNCFKKKIEERKKNAKETRLLKQALGRKKKYGLNYKITMPNEKGDEGCF